MKSIILFKGEKTRITASIEMQRWMVPLGFGWGDIKTVCYEDPTNYELVSKRLVIGFFCFALSFDTKFEKIRKESP